MYREILVHRFFCSPRGRSRLFASWAKVADARRQSEMDLGLDTAWRELYIRARDRHAMCVRLYVCADYQKHDQPRVVASSTWRTRNASISTLSAPFWPRASCAQTALAPALIRFLRRRP